MAIVIVRDLTNGRIRKSTHSQIADGMSREIRPAYPAYAPAADAELALAMAISISGSLDIANHNTWGLHAVRQLNVIPRELHRLDKGLVLKDTLVERMRRR